MLLLVLQQCFAAAPVDWVNPTTNLATFRAGLLDLRSYDYERRPLYANATVKEAVRGDFVVHDYKVDMYSERVSLTLTLTLHWAEDRLTYNATADAFIAANGIAFPFFEVDPTCSSVSGCRRSDAVAKERIWTPHVTFIGELDRGTVMAASLVVYANGSVTWRRRMQITLGCEFKLTLLPFDIQKCRLALAQIDTDALAVEIAPSFDGEGLAGGGEYLPYLANEHVCFRRATAFWLLQVILQVGVFFVLSYTSLWVAPSPGRVTLAVLPILMMVNKLSSIATFIPRTSSVTWIDIYILLNLACTSVPMIELAVVDVIKRGHIRLKHYAKEVKAEGEQLQREHDEVINTLVGEAVDQVLEQVLVSEQQFDADQQVVFEGQMLEAAAAAGREEQAQDADADAGASASAATAAAATAAGGGVESAVGTPAAAAGGAEESESSQAPPHSAPTDGSVDGAAQGASAGASISQGFSSVAGMSPALSVRPPLSFVTPRTPLRESGEAGEGRGSVAPATPTTTQTTATPSSKRSPAIANIAVDELKLRSYDDAMNALRESKTRRKALSVEVDKRGKAYDSRSDDDSDEAAEIGGTMDDGYGDYTTTHRHVHRHVHHFAASPSTRLPLAHSRARRITMSPARRSHSPQHTGASSQSPISFNTAQVASPPPLTLGLSADIDAEPSAPSSMTKLSRESIDALATHAVEVARGELPVHLHGVATRVVAQRLSIAHSVMQVRHNQRSNTGGGLPLSLELPPAIMEQAESTTVDGASSPGDSVSSSVAGGSGSPKTPMVRPGIGLTRLLDKLKSAAQHRQLREGEAPEEEFEHALSTARQSIIQLTTWNGENSPGANHVEQSPNGGHNAALASKLGEVVTHAARHFRALEVPRVSLGGFCRWLRVRYTNEPPHMRVDFHMRWLLPALFILIHVFMSLWWLVQRAIIVHGGDVCYAEYDRSAQTGWEL